MPVLDKLKSDLASFPGITKKQAEKITFFLVDNREKTQSFIDNLNALVEMVDNCALCGFITSQKICAICSDNTRDKVLVIVENSVDVNRIESTGAINGYYHVLGGILDVKEKVQPKDLNLDNLEDRAKDFKEVILALSPNLEGMVTMNFLKSLLHDSKVSQLAQGIPMGASLEYMDELTIKSAIKNRKG